MTGATPEQAAVQLTEAGADIIGANCGCGIELYVGICARLRAATGKPIWIKANAGLPEMVNGVTRYSMSAQEFAGYAKSMRECGSSLHRWMLRNQSGIHPRVMYGTEG